MRGYCHVYDRHGFHPDLRVPVYMRDPKRIYDFCNRLAACWSKVPDWRFGQLIANVLGQYVADTGRDIFFPEDKEIIEYIEKYFAPVSGNTPFG